MPPDSALTCYADDTLVLIWGSAWERTVRPAKMTVACMLAIKSIKGLGLEMSPEKSEALWFCRRTVLGEPPAGYRLRMGGVGNRMKYLDLTLDSYWAFDARFERLAPSVEATANALGRLLPRLGGPGFGCAGFLRGC
jgi:hypothetical protein